MKRLCEKNYNALGIQYFLCSFIIHVRNMGNTGFFSCFPVSGEEIGTFNLIKREFSCSSHKLLQAAGKLVSQGTECNGTIRNIFHLFFADFLFYVKVGCKNLFCRAALIWISQALAMLMKTSTSGLEITTHALRDNRSSPVAHQTIACVSRRIRITRERLLRSRRDPQSRLTHRRRRARTLSNP